MSTPNKLGRPKASSRETLAEAALELFLERGYVATSVSDITSRAGVSRSSFFNYFAAKSDVIWSGLDDRITVLVDTLALQSGGEPLSDVRSAILAMVEGFAPDALALALSNGAAMGAEEELRREGAARAAVIGGAVAARLIRDGFSEVRADVLAGAFAGGVISSTRRWAQAGSGRVPLAEKVREALDVAGEFAS